MIARLCILFALCTSDIVGPVTYVVDGDTIRIDGRSIRLQGLDAEELSETNGPAARLVMQQIVKGQTVTCVPDGTVSYERVVARCYIHDIDIAIPLIAAGWALDCPRFSKGRYRKFEPPGSRSYLIQKGYCK